MNLVGAWRLVEWRTTRPGGRISHPFGRDAVGLLCYTPDGYVSVTIAQAGRPPLPGGVPRKAPLQARAEAFTSFFCYSGRYEVRDGHVAHDVEVALNPSFTGTIQIREANFDGNRLILAADEEGRWHTLIWRRG
ncbi:lipocalin-like domain-containing protein [Streptosporangium sp. NBC_01639]|uniref:lipocalin-like domain-containing protein n=1 Tax=unclassified Streptosporangium TaxID=2632669 RepID=UPI002DDC4DF8|nr:lipocalin-like domain-containing protein [Streptosporangium sp. NBC_01756]WSC84259.1 lipocalin-like domain-containing protein [Streptosporangium sp. NBC_01756]WTD57124.1 lipocalin-like domain-containing protein [Streptosporangium sp. NBC_01639]